MDTTRPHSRLRTFLVAWFIPIATLPLVALGIVTSFLVSTAVDRELQRRSISEAAALARNLDLFDRKILRQMFNLARKDDLLIAVQASDPPLVHESVSASTGSLALDQLEVFDRRGRLVYKLGERQQRTLEKIWKDFLVNPEGRKSDRDPAGLEETRKSRNPNFTAQDFVDVSKRFDQPRQLAAAFRRFLRSEESFVLRRVDNGSLEIVYHHVMLDQDYQTAGFLVGRLNLDELRLSALSAEQNLPLILVDPEGKILTGSNKKLNQIELKGRSPVENQELWVGEEPFAFYWREISNEAGDRLAYLGFGLEKSSQVALRTQIYSVLGILILVLLVAVVFLTLKVSTWITKPVSQLVEAAERVRMGQWIQPIDSDESSEIGILVKRFNEMAQSVQVTKRMLELKLEELAQAHNDLTKTQGQLVQSAKLSSLGQLVAGVAHELNNPIAFIYSNMTQMRLSLDQIDELSSRVAQLKEHLPPSERKSLEHFLNEIDWETSRRDMRDMVQSCLEGSIRVKDIVLGLRNFSRLDRGQVESVNLHAALESTVKLLASQLKNRIEIVWKLEANPMLDCHATQLNQVLMNLIANAAQAIPQRGIITVTTRDVMFGPLSHQEQAIELRIRDSGKGIPQELIEKIFDPFFTTKRVGEGTGLGLSIVYGIVEKHGGVISVRSSTKENAGENTGTEFVVTWPRSAGAAQDSVKKTGTGSFS